MSIQEEKNIFEEQMTRIRQITGTRTQLELAEFLGIRQSSVSDAKRRARIPADWLVTLMRVKDVHPEWILTGDGPCHVSAPRQPGQYETGDVIAERWDKEASLRRLSSKDLANELLRRIVISQADTYTR